MAKNIVHVESVVRVILGELTDDGYIIDKTPFEFNLAKLTPDILQGLVKAVESAKANLRQQGQPLEALPADEPKVSQK